MANIRKKMGELLLDEGLISEDQLQEALETQKNAGMKLGETLIYLGYAREDDVLLTMKQQLNLPILDVTRFEVGEDVLKYLPEDVARKYEAIPLEASEGKLVVAMSDPTDNVALDHISHVSGMPVSPVLSRKNDILKAIDRYYSYNEA